METLLGGLAFGCLIAAQFFAVVAVHNERWENESRITRARHSGCLESEFKTTSTATS
jgi:hypothetical protein